MTSGCQKYDLPSISVPLPKACSTGTNDKDHWDPGLFTCHTLLYLFHQRVVYLDQLSGDLITIHGLEPSFITPLIWGIAYSDLEALCKHFDMCSGQVKQCTQNIYWLFRFDEWIASFYFHGLLSNVFNTMTRGRWFKVGGMCTYSVF